MFLFSSANAAISDTASLLAPPNHADAEDSEPEPEVEESGSELEFEEEEEVANDDSGEDKEEAEDTNPAMNSKKSAGKGKPTRKSAPPDVGSLGESMGNLKVRDDLDPKSDVFSFDWKVPVVKKDYVKNNVDKFEVEFLCHPMETEKIKCVLAKNGKGLAFWHSTPEFFGEEKRMKAQMGRDAFKSNDPRVQAHRNFVQEVRLIKKPSNGVFWGNEPQIVKLPVKVEGPPTKETCLIKLGAINGHNQYFMVVTYVFRVAKVRIRKEKGPKVTYCDELSSESEGSDINEDDDDEFMEGVTID